MITQGLAGQRVYFLVRSASTNLPITGDATNLTTSVVKDGTRQASTNAASEVDATNAPGVYELELALAETIFASVLPVAASSTAGAVVELLPMGPTSSPGVRLLGPFVATGTPTPTTVTAAVQTDEPEAPGFAPIEAQRMAQMLLVVQSGEQRGQVRAIASSGVSDGTLTLTFDEMTAAMAAGDAFMVGGLS